MRRRGGQRQRLDQPGLPAVPRRRLDADHQGLLLRLVLPVRRGPRPAQPLRPPAPRHPLRRDARRGLAARRADLHLVRAQHVGRVLRRRAPPRNAAEDPRPRPDRQPRSGDGRVPPRLHRHRPSDPRRLEDDQERRDPPARPAGEPVRAAQLRAAAGVDRHPLAAHPPASSNGSSSWATTSGARSRCWSTGTSATSPSRPARTARSGCSAGGTTTGSGSSRGCSTSTSCRGCRAAPATAPGSPTARTPSSSRRSSPCSTPTARCTR